MGSPAARISDPHACPVHGGGPILPAGEPTVLIGSVPAARATDLCTCVGPPDVIAAGSPTVLIGGRPAARMGDPCVHGGIVTGGLPTVLIGSAFDAAAAGVSPATPVAFGAYEAPRDLVEAGARLAGARVLIEAQGHVPRYSDEELLDRAQKPVTDRYVVRFMEAKYLHARGAADGYGGNLGGPLAGTGGIKYWGTTFEDLEDADTDPALIAAKLGIPTYDASTSYALLILDREKGCPPAGSEVIVPTYGNLATLAQDKIAKQFPEPERIDSVLTEAYSEEYATQMDAAASQGLSVWKPAQLEAFKSTMAAEEAAAFDTRFRIHSTLGANEAFVGNGLTKQLGAQGKEFGAVETFVYDPDPQPISAHIAANQIAVFTSGLRPTGRA